MQANQTIATLWEQLRDAIDAAYAASPRTGEPTPLHDYRRDATVDELERLLQAETANERQHRRTTSAPKGFSARTASMLILCSNAATGARKQDLPPSTIFLIWRKTAAEAEVLGWLAREHLSAEWLSQVESLDYAKLMEVTA